MKSVYQARDQRLRPRDNVVREPMGWSQGRHLPCPPTVGEFASCFEVQPAPHRWTTYFEFFVRARGGRRKQPEKIHARNNTALVLTLSCILVSTLVVSEHTSQLGHLQASLNPVQEIGKRGAIRGRILGTDSGLGLKNASLVLRLQEGSELLTASTDPQGEYQFKELKPGKYLLRARCNGHVSQTYGQKSGGLVGSEGGMPLEVRAGETLDNIEFRLIRCGVVVGRIVDQDNNPIVRANVQVVRSRTYRGKQELLPVASASTDDRGHYRVFDVPPGIYYLTAVLGQLGVPEPEGAIQPAYQPTYYPGVLSLEEASKIQVAPGAEIQGVDVTLIRTTSYAISGRVLGTDGKPATAGIVSIQRVDTDDVMRGSFGGGNLDVGGQFKITKLLSGRYRLTAFNNRDGNVEAASTAVDLVNEDVGGVSLVLGNGAEISGQIRIEGDGAGTRPNEIQIRLMPESGTLGARFFGGRASSSEVRSDLTFTISGVTEGTYRFMVKSPEDNSYVKSIRAQGQELSDESFELRNNQRLGNVEVLISTRGGQLSGAVKASGNGDPINGATVVLFSTDTTKRGVSRFTKTSQTDHRGNFLLKGIVPGEYAICALLNHEPGSESHPAYLGEIERNAKRVVFQSGSTLNESLTVFPAPALE